MKKTVLLIMAFLAIIIGCSDDVIQDDVINTAEVDGITIKKYLEPLMDFDIRDYNPNYQARFTENRGALKTKTFRIRESGNMVVLPAEEGNCLESEVFVLVQGEGHVTHMGLTTVNIPYCSFDGFYSNYPIYSTLTAANGDEIISYLTLAEVDFGTGIGIQIWEVDGGSGRFDGATGEITLDVQFNFMNSTWSNEGVGIITY